MPTEHCCGLRCSENSDALRLNERLLFASQDVCYECQTEAEKAMLSLYHGQQTDFEGV